ncbi:Npt1/Npt2 family nucleotide transporter [Anaerolineales bacterium HSG24]|nr:Npt1/Npt2 family nucleotide transporter [Anaerolineales bacterium HSG24]
MKAIQSSLNQLFNIKTEEWPRTILLFVIAILSSAGFTWGLTISYAAFLQLQGGSGLETLPWILVMIAIASVVAITVYTPFVDRIADDKLHNIIFCIECVGIVFGLILLQFNYESIAYPFLYLWGIALIAVINPHQATYFNNFYNTQAAKRVLPVVNAGYRVGGILAGLSMAYLNSLFDGNPQVIVFIWFLTHFVMMGIVWGLPYLINETQNSADYSSSTTPTSQKKHASSYIDNIREGYRYTIESNYLRWIAISTLLLMILLALLEYRSTELLLNEFSTATDLADFLGKLVAVSNFFVVPMLMFGISRIIARLGLGNASLIFPVGNLAICTGLIFSPNLFSASAAYLARTDFRLAFQFPIEGLLYNAVSLKIKGRARAFVSGLLTQIGLLIGGLLLVIVTLMDVTLLIIPLIGGLAVAYLGSTLVIRKLYSQALIKLLEQEDFSFLFARNSSELSAVDPETLKFLEQKFTESDDPEFMLFMANIISQIGGSQATSILTKAVRETTIANRAGIIDVMVATEMSGKEVEQLYVDLLTDPSGNVRQSALSGLEQLKSIKDEQFLSLVLQMLDDSEIKVRVQTLMILADVEDFYALPRAIDALNQILSLEDPNQCMQGIRVLGEIADIRTSRSLHNVTKPVFRLTTFLNNSHDQIRLQAVLALEKISTNPMTEQLSELILQQMNSLINDPVERIRQATLVTYSHLSSKEANQVLVQALTDTSPTVRSTAVTEMVKIGKSVIPVIHPKLNSSQPELQKIAAIILSRINKQEFGSLISTYVTSNLLSIYRNYGYLDALQTYINYTSIVVLQSTLQEQNQQLLDEIFYLLSALHEDKTMDIILTSLRSLDEHIQANALEALETITTPQTAKLIGPLVNPATSPEFLIQLSQETWDMNHPNSTKIIKEFTSNTDNSWFQAVMIFALGEMAMTLAATTGSKKKSRRKKPSAKLGDTATSRKNSRKSRKGSLDLLDMLGENEKDTDEKKEPSSRRKRRRNPLAMLTDTSEQETAETPSRMSSTELILPFKTQAEIAEIVDDAITDTDIEVRIAAQSAKRMMAGLQIVEMRMIAHSASHLMRGKENDIINEEEFMLSAIEKIIFLKKVPFFQGMTIDQLKTLSTVCEEELFEEDTRIFKEGDAGGILYVVVSGKVAIEQEGKRKGSFARLATIDAHSYFGEMNLFDNSPRTNSAIAIQDTLALRLRREPLVVLARRYPDLSLELINVLSQRLREVNDQVVGLTRTKPRELHKLFDQYE